MQLLKLVLSVATVLSLGGVASAESQRDRQERACQADAMKFCKDLVPDEEKIAACMGKHRAELSVPCGNRFRRGNAEELTEPPRVMADKRRTIVFAFFYE